MYSKKPGYAQNSYEATFKTTNTPFNPHLLDIVVIAIVLLFANMRLLLTITNIANNSNVNQCQPFWHVFAWILIILSESLRLSA